jgi:hypothetical protein
MDDWSSQDFCLESRTIVYQQTLTNATVTFSSTACAGYAVIQ